MSIYYCFKCDQQRDNDYHPISDDGICSECEWRRKLCAESGLPDEKDVDLTPKGNDEDFISKDQIRNFAKGLGLTACIALSSQSQAQHRPEVNVYLGSGRHEVPEQMMEMAMNQDEFSWNSTSGEEHKVFITRHTSKWKAAEFCGRREKKVRFSTNGVTVLPSEPVIGCYRGIGNNHYIHAWVSKNGKYEPIMLHELGHFIGYMEDQDAHFHDRGDREVIH